MSSSFTIFEGDFNLILIFKCFMRPPLVEKGVNCDWEINDW